MSCNMRRNFLPISSLSPWCELYNVRFSGAKVEETEGKGYGLVAERDLSNEVAKSGNLALLSVPRELVLSAEAVVEYAKVDRNLKQLLDAVGQEVRSPSATLRPTGGN